MKIAVYFCTCGNRISEQIDAEKIRSVIEDCGGKISFKIISLPCGEAGSVFIEKDLRENPPDRVVIAACSPRKHEETFRSVMVRAGMNPYLMQMVNIRELIAWVAPGREQATAKACIQIRAAIRRVQHHVPLEKIIVNACPDVLILGAGAAGLKSALTLAEAGRKVTVVERRPVIGGMAAMYDELFPDMECGPCMLEPVESEILHGPHAANIELLLQSDLAELTGFFGNFTAKIRQAPRHINTGSCISCMECVNACPASATNEFNCNFNQRKAIDLAFFGGLPNTPFLDESSCARWTRKNDCRKCLEACPVEKTILYEQENRLVERKVGAVLVAVGADLYDCSQLPGLGYGKLPDSSFPISHPEKSWRSSPSSPKWMRKNARAAVPVCRSAPTKPFRSTPPRGWPESMPPCAAAAEPVWPPAHPHPSPATISPTGKSPPKSGSC
ncbi:MAG: FAD-dependent oxidoreductase [Verrucomicrobiae bacterium]|nr:FAD-dependent oxidoreductase [Verrucomicrobiae bacterium]